MPPKQTQAPETPVHIHKKGLLWVATIALVLLSISQAVSAFKAVHPTNHMTVTGEGKQKAVPDMAIVTLGVTTIAQSADDAQKQSNEKINTITAFLKSQNVDPDNIKTSMFNIYPNQDYNSGKPSITSYTASQTVDVTVKGIDKNVEVLNKILSGVTQNGANQIQNVSMSFEDPAAASSKAKELAIQDAKTKAQAQAKAAGLKLGKITNVSDNGDVSGPLPYPSYSKGMDAGDSANVHPGSTEITESMSVTFEIK